MTGAADHGWAGDERLSVRIRSATRDAHREAEHTPYVQDLLAGRLPLADYTRLLVQHHAVYTVLEEAVAANTDPVVAPFLAPGLARLPSITADLEFLAGADWPDRKVTLADTAAYCQHVRAACDEWPGGLLAHHYVRYLGDLSGGQLIARVLRRVYHLVDHRGTEFYRFPAIPSPRAFKVRYRRLLDALAWEEPARLRLIGEIRTAYRLNADILFALSPLPTLARNPLGGAE